MKVFVYFNLHRKCWSVKALEGRRSLMVLPSMLLTLSSCTIGRFYRRLGYDWNNQLANEHNIGDTFFIATPEINNV